MEIEEAIEELNLKGDPKKNTTKIIKGLKSKATQILKYGVPLAVRLASQGLINIDAETDKAIDKTLEKATENKLASYGKMKVSMEAFKEKLIALSSLLQEEGGLKPIIFFVDELDRCRPSYAIKLLENIKHLFNTNGYIFILGIDREQLVHTVCSVYGQGMDADGYLKRFIDVEYPLPTPTTENYVGFLVSSYNLREDVFSKRREGGFDLDNLRVTFVALAQILKLSLRTQNQCMAQLNFICRSIPRENFLSGSLLTFLVIIKNINPGSYNLARLDKEYEKLIPMVESSPNADEFRETNQWFLIKAGLIHSQNWNYKDRKVVNLIESFEKKGDAVNNSERVKKENKRLADLLRHYNNTWHGSICKYLTDYIDLADINP